MERFTQYMITALVFLVPFVGLSLDTEINFTVEDRDRIIRTEQKLESLKTEMAARFESVDQRFESIDKRFEAMDKRFEAMDKRFDQLFNFLWAIVGIFTAMMVSVFGFAFWDRKLSLAPLKKEDQRIISILIDFSETHPRLREILRNAGIL